MEKNKIIEIKRLFIYLALSFGLTWIIFFAAIFNGFKWDDSNQNMQQFIGLGMLMPFAAHILTRILTKEDMTMTGKDSVMLGISFADKKWKYYLFAILVPWLYFELSHAIMLMLVPGSFSTNILKEAGLNNAIAFANPFIVIVSCTLVSFAALGEEGGWRGYMMPKLMKLMSVPKAIIVGGIIWGLWHAPITCVGHNFGTDYPGFPYVGIVLMCVNCTLIGIMFTYLTVKTQSIWPAAIMHAVNNGNPTILKFFIDGEIFSQKFPGNIAFFIIMTIPIAIVDAVIIVKEINSKKAYFRVDK